MSYNIYIYGAGKLGKRACEFIQRSRIDISGILVSDRQSNPDILCGVPVIEYDATKIDIKNSLIIIALKQRFLDEVLPRLEADGCAHIQVYRSNGIAKENNKERTGSLKVVIFGAGRFSRDRRPFFYEDEVLCYLDNSPEAQETMIDDKDVLPPKSVADLNYDLVCVMSSRYGDEMKAQLLSEGVPAEKILDFSEFRMKFHRILPVRFAPDYLKPVLFTPFETMNFTPCDAPAVSIIIPAHNQFGYTYNCLRSVLSHSGNNVPYEVIVADDLSSDVTSSLEILICGITVLHNTENLGFLKNCNKAASYARGKYILFLNNDTQVQPGWLNPLVSLIESDAGIGMVGSKLIYPDGRLQEAGGILWKDGSAWNYGKNKNPTLPEFNYVKDVDYISGASIMIRADLWKEIGGFDERFCPAYCEDSDLAFEVRRHGYRVVYQPESVVVHFEGKSNGTDTSSGVKKYQVENGKKFYEKWKEVLEAEHFSNAENVFLARDRSQGKKRILVVENNVPAFDSSAGARLVFMYLRLFIQLGLQVTFLPSNLFKHEPYTETLSQMGIHVLYGSQYYDNLEIWIEQNAKYFDYVYLQRPEIAIKYMDMIKRHSKAKVFYFDHDLHHIRLRREYEITKEVSLLEESEYYKKIEYDLFSKADVIHVVGTYEQKIVQTMFPEKKVRNIPLYIYEQIPSLINKNFTTRKGVLFVGGFNHRPNVDSAIWFSNRVFPTVLKCIPDLIWYIVGSNVPDEIVALQSANIDVKGFLSDDELVQLYNSCKIAVAPLRYGAGVKGKVVEAAYYQIPLVTTSIGAEGLDPKSEAFIIEDDPQKMADEITRLYNDIDRLKTMSDAGANFIKKYFTPDVAKTVLSLDMDIM